MVFTCEAAECGSHSRKLKHLDKYPWMSGIRWVKWPRNRLALARWKRLIRREGRSIKGSENDCDFARDVLKLSKRSRLCSLHFDEDQIDDGGFAKGDPKYFAWNNWGKPLQTRSTSTLTKLNAARSSNSKANDASSACLTQPPSLNSHCEKMECYDVPVTTSYFGKTVAVGRMRPLLQSWVGTPQPIDHDYLHSAVPNLVSIASQTDLTLEDIDHLECLAKSSSPPGQNIVDAITKTDERVNFYTGIQSRSLLEGIFNSVKFGIDYMKFWRTSDSAKEKKYEQNSSRRPGRRQEVPAYFQFIMCLIRIRLNLPLLVLADLFCVSTSTVTKITITWVSYLHQTIVPALLIWPTQEQIRGWMPLEFRKEFPCTRVLLDCADFL
ncbi:uncharacterized protein [Ptychodera flava]|uniref:uncharacterized protein n=1 Tax=Ptychodera flava TaxID=63121 RepID=UPI003969CF10